jgi:hypothetical protein
MMVSAIVPIVVFGVRENVTDFGELPFVIDQGDDLVFVATDIEARTACQVLSCEQEAL